MLFVKKPKYFDFKNTLLYVQRSKSDPINEVNDNVWRRCLLISEKKIIVDVSESNKILMIQPRTSKFNRIVIKNEIKRLLGFDDPLLQEFNFKLTANEFKKIESVRAIALPCYATLFETVVQTIIGQQISSVVADRMRANLVRKFGDYQILDKQKYYIFPTANALKKTKFKSLKKIGLSDAKTKSILSTANCFDDLIWLDKIQSVSNDEVVSMMKPIFGIGNWTISWFLLRGLRRKEFVPSDDLVMRKAMTWWWNQDNFLSSKEIQNHSKKFGELRGMICYRIMLAYMHKFMKR